MNNRSHIPSWVVTLRHDYMSHRQRFYQVIQQKEQHNRIHHRPLIDATFPSRNVWSRDHVIQRKQEEIDSDSIHMVLDTPTKRQWDIEFGRLTNETSSNEIMSIIDY